MLPRDQHPTIGQVHPDFPDYPDYSKHPKFEGKTVVSATEARTITEDHREWPYFASVAAALHVSRRVLVAAKKGHSEITVSSKDKGELGLGCILVDVQSILRSQGFSIINKKKSFTVTW